MTTGLVHDYLLAMRGAERTFAAIADLWPEAPIYTLLYDEETTDGRFADRDVQCSLLQGSRVRQRGLHRLQRMFPWAIRRLRLGDCDLVVSSSTGYALGIHPRGDAVHVCYCHSPLRFAWHGREQRLAQANPLGRPFVRAGTSMIRRGDRGAATRVTDFVANSATTRDRIAEFYERESTIIHPPVDVDRFAPGPVEDYFLVVSELAPHKRVDVALEAAKLAGKKVKVVGSGEEYRRLYAAYGGSAEFMRRLDDAEMARLYAGAQALIVANVEDFGIAAVESQAAGRPVLGIDEGGTKETVVHEQTGIRVPDSVDSLADALRSVDFTAFDSAAIQQHAQQFSLERFQREFRRHVDRVRHAA